MGFIDWLTKDTDVEVEKNKTTEQNFDNEPCEDVFEELKEISNVEKTQIAEYEDQDFYEEDDSFDLAQNSFNDTSNMGALSKSSQNASFTIFKVEDEEDLRHVLKHVGQNLSCIATFNSVKKKELASLMKYLNGGLYVLGASISEWQKDSYIIVPRGMSINMQEKSKRKR